jgi:hypothetical protein
MRPWFLSIVLLENPHNMVAGFPQMIDSREVKNKPHGLSLLNFSVYCQFFQEAIGYTDQAH